MKASPSGWDAPIDTPPKLKSKPSSPATGTAEAQAAPPGPERCEIHHIVPWEQGGLTDIDSMCLACPHCHHNIHDRGYIVTKTNTGYKIINPNNPPGGP